MHGFSSASSLLVNAEVDSMGGIVDSGVGISTEASPHQAAIVKTQVELRLEYDVREERRRELEFLEKGGNPLDFKFEVVAPVSVQSSSLADQLHCQFRACEAKGSFSLAASPHGDSIGSSGRQGATVACEPNSADNFDGENELIASEGKSTYATRSNATPSENSSQLDGSQNVRASEDSPIFQPKKAYRRRNRSKTNRDSARSSSIGIVPHGGHNSSLSDCHGVVTKVVHESASDIKMAAPDPTNGGLDGDKLDLSSSKHIHDDLHKQNVEDVGGASTTMASVEPDPFIGVEQTACTISEFPTCSGTEKPESNGVAKQLRESDQLKGHEQCSQTEGIVSSIAITLKGLDSESSCTQTSVSADRNVNLDSGLSTSLKNVDKIEEQVEQMLPLELTDNINSEMHLSDRKAADVAESDSCMNDNHISQNCQASIFSEKDEGGSSKIQLSAQYEAQDMPSARPLQSNNHTSATSSVKQVSLDETIHKVEGCCSEKTQQPHTSDEHTKTDISCSASTHELQLCDENQTKVVDKEHAEWILEEARNINAKHKIIKDLSLGSIPKEYRRKSHWDFVLEEMAWMANDFAQERVWKRTAATQLCYRAAFASRLRLEEQNRYGRDKVVAQTLAKAVADFWHSAAFLVEENDNKSRLETCEHDMATSENTNGDRNRNGRHNEEYPGKNVKLAVQGYAVRFLQHNSSILPIVKDTSSATPERVSTVAMPELAYQNQHTEENLFYVVPHRAMEAYRNFVERYLMQCERASKNMQEVITSTYEAVAGNEYEENEGENMYYLPGAFEGSMASKLAQKNWSNPKLYSPRLYDVGGDFSYVPCMENRTSCPQSPVKRPADGLNVCPLPTKRVRTASRQRVVGPFRSGPAGFMSVPSRTDASSGDTNSFQDDQSTECDRSLIPKGLEVESGMDYNKQAAFDSTEIAAKPKKKKKSKHQAPRWQVDCSMQIEQRDHFKKRLERHQFNSNCNNGVFGPQAKKPKTVKLSLDENTTLMGGSVASPVVSQMSNMSNPNKLIKLIGGRDRGRKTKSLKMQSRQTGPGSPWSLFEDQALVVLVHDMGPNWELVSDAINSTLHFKCIYRKPKECRERHRILLEKSCGDGADTEDSGSSQPYPSTLPGIPKGGARQLFQQLRGPIEEDTIKSHFEKIILIGQELHCRKKEPKQLVPAHSSHQAALSQVITNNLNGGVLTPLDLCDMDVSSPDIFALSPHTGGLPLPNQGAVQSMLPSSTNSSHQGSAAAQPNGTVRNGRYGIPRTLDEQQRVQQHNHTLSGRNTQQPNTNIPGTFSANDRGGPVLPCGNGMVVSGINRSMSMPRPELHGVSSSPIPSSASMAAGQGNSVLRPRDGLHMARPGQNPEHHRQMSSEMQMQGSHINNQGFPAFGGLSSTFPSQSASPGSVYPVRHQQQHLIPRQHSNVLSNSQHPHLQGSAHVGSSEQQAFAMRLARQRMLQRQQQQQNQQFPASGALISTALQNSSQIQSPAATSQPVSLPPLTTPSSPFTPSTSKQQQKHQSGTSAMVNQGGKPKQRQAQQLQKSGRNHLPQRQPPQSQQTKPLKGIGRGNLPMLQSHSLDSSHRNGVSHNPGSQLEKERTKTIVPHAIQSHVPQKLYSNSVPASPKQVQQMQSHTDSSNPSQVAVVTSTSTISSSNQHISPPILPSPSFQQLKVNVQPPPLKLVDDNQPTAHREVSQICVANSDQLSKPQNDQREAEQKLENNTSSMSTISVISPICNKSANAIPLASSAGLAQRKTSEPLGDSVVPNSQLGSIDTPSKSNTSNNEPVSPGSQCLGTQLLSNSLASHGSFGT